MPTLNWIGKEAVVRHHKEVPFRLLEHRSGFDDLLGHSITYRIALGPHQGRKACMDSSSFASTSLKGKRVDCQRVSGL